MFLGFARAAGVKLGPILRRFSLPDDAAERREIAVTVRVVQELPDALAEQLDDPLLGLHVAAAIPRGAYGLTEYLLRNAPSVGEACRRMSRYTLLLDDVTINSFAIERDEAIVELRVPDDPACLGRHGNELALAFIARVFFESLPRGWAPRRLSFAHAAPPVTRGLVSYFRTSRITFGCGLNRLVLGVEDLDRPIAGSDAALLTLLDEQAERLVASHANPNDLWLRIRREIRAALPDGAPRLERIAAAIGMSPRSLQRRLDERNTGFLDLVDAIRRDLALLHLGNEALALTEIAYLVGYSDTGTFIRAFRRWTGLTPAAYRKRSRSSLA